jgi:hypothetical protein
LLKTAELPGTTYNEYLLKLQEELPVINAHFYITKEGDRYPLSEGSAYSEQLNQYQYIGYNDAMDKKDKQSKYFQFQSK